MTRTSKPRTKRKNGKDINGIILLDKPTGITSNRALQTVKHTLNANKAGHTGSLDPLATGMLPICLGEATKFSQFILEADKTYEVTARLGTKTTTGDAEGDILFERPVDVSESSLHDVLENFKGEIDQIPSMFSAIKQNGQPLYRLARRGIEVERKSRQVTIDELTLLSLTEDSFSLQVHCSKGTYIRTLVTDIGDELGCGAYVMALRRLNVADYQESDMVTLEQLESTYQSGGLEAVGDYFLPLETSVIHWPMLKLTQATSYYLTRGQAVQVPQAPPNGWIRLYSQENQFLGIGEIMDDGRIAPRRMVAS